LSLADQFLGVPDSGGGHAHLVGDLAGRHVHRAEYFVIDVGALLGDTFYEVGNSGIDPLPTSSRLKPPMLMNPTRPASDSEAPRPRSGDALPVSRNRAGLGRRSASTRRTGKRSDGVVLQAQPNLGNQARSMNCPSGHGLHFVRRVLKIQGPAGWTRRMALGELIRRYLNQSVGRDATLLA
jgi:hypothetical protein